MTFDSDRSCRVGTLRLGVTSLACEVWVSVPESSTKGRKPRCLRSVLLCKEEEKKGVVL